MPRRLRLLLSILALTLAPVAAPSVAAMRMCEFDEDATLDRDGEARCDGALGGDGPDAARPPSAGRLDGPWLSVGGGEFTMSCLAPGYVACSWAFAVSGQECRDIAWLGRVCVAANFGAAGATSSVAVTGGGAAGVVHDDVVSCEWTGSGGGCASFSVRLGSTCTEQTATAQGYVSIGSVGALLAPPATARSSGCSGILEGARPPSVTRALDELLAHAEVSRDAPPSLRDALREARSQFDERLDAAAAATEERARSEKPAAGASPTHA